MNVTHLLPTLSVIKIFWSGHFLNPVSILNHQHVELLHTCLREIPTELQRYICSKTHLQFYLKKWCFNFWTRWLTPLVQMELLEMEAMEIILTASPSKRGLCNTTLVTFCAPSDWPKCEISTLCQPIMSDNRLKPQVDGSSLSPVSSLALHLIDRHCHHEVDSELVDFKNVDFLAFGNSTLTDNTLTSRAERCVTSLSLSTGGWMMKRLEAQPRKLILGPWSRCKESSTDNGEHDVHE